jgi:ribosome recycling factor
MKFASNLLLLRNFASKSFSLSSLQTKMQSQIDSLRKHLLQIRTNTPSPSLLDKILISHSGSQSLLPTISQIQLKDTHFIIILPDEQLTVLAEKAIRNQKMGLNPSKIDTNILKVPIPK